MEIVKSEKRYMTMPELCEYLSLSKRTIYHLISKRKLPFIPLSKRSYRFDREEVNRWMLKQQIKTLEHYREKNPSIAA